MKAVPASSGTWPGEVIVPLVPANKSVGDKVTVPSEVSFQDNGAQVCGAEKIRPEVRYSWWRDWTELCKVRLNSLVLYTVVVGYVSGSAWQGGWTEARLFWTLLGTALLAFGASVLNQYLERDLDARMVRTQRRPLPAGRVSPESALRGGVLLACAGLLVLVATTPPITALLGATTLGLYLGVYTPLKTRSTINTLVGAVAGALPPLIGWSAARGELEWPAWSLFLMQFLWQFPHFWAIAWLYREDYARASMKMVPVLDPNGRMTGRLLVNHCLVLAAVSFSPVLTGLSGTRYLVAAVALGAAFVLSAWWFLLTPNRARARLVLWTSLIYLPALFTILLVDGTA